MAKQQHHDEHKPHHVLWRRAKKDWVKQGLRDQNGPDNQTDKWVHACTCAHACIYTCPYMRMTNSYAYTHITYIYIYIYPYILVYIGSIVRPSENKEALAGLLLYTLHTFINIVTSFAQEFHSLCPTHRSALQLAVHDG